MCFILDILKYLSCHVRFILLRAFLFIQIMKKLHLSQVVTSICFNVQLGGCGSINDHAHPRVRKMDTLRITVLLIAFGVVCGLYEDQVGDLDWLALISSSDEIVLARSSTGNSSTWVT